MHTWHDYHLVGYTVDGVAKELKFQLRWPYASATNIRSAILTFQGVEGYLLNHDLGNNIIYAIEEIPVGEFLIRNATLFEVEVKQSGWPLFWRHDVQETQSYLKKIGAKCIEISTSYGLDGWVIAKSAEPFPNPFHAIEE